MQLIMYNPQYLPSIIGGINPGISANQTETMLKVTHVNNHAKIFIGRNKNIKSIILLSFIH